MDQTRSNNNNSDPVGRMEVYGVSTEYDSEYDIEEESPGNGCGGGEEVSIGSYEEKASRNDETQNGGNNNNKSMRKLMHRIGQGMSTGFLFKSKSKNKKSGGQSSSSSSSVIDYENNRRKVVNDNSKMTITENGEVEITPTTTTNNNANASSSSYVVQQQPSEIISIKNNNNNNNKKDHYSVGMTYEEEEFSEITPGVGGLEEARERSYETKERRLVRRRFETCIIWILLLLSAFTMIYLGMKHHRTKNNEGGS